MNHIIEYLLNHGYVILFAWVLAEQAGAPIPSAPILLAAGALVGFGRMSCAAALGLALAACLIGDCVWFCLGQRRGPAILGILRRVSFHQGVGITEMRSLFSRYGSASIVLSKFVPGFGILVPPLAGSLEVSALNFLVLDACGALAWAGSHILLGYLFRKNLETLASVCARAGFLVAVSVFTALAIVVAIRRLRCSESPSNPASARRKACRIVPATWGAIRHGRNIAERSGTTSFLTPGAAPPHAPGTSQACRAASRRSSREPVAAARFPG